MSHHDGAPGSDSLTDSSRKFGLQGHTIDQSHPAKEAEEWGRDIRARNWLPATNDGESSVARKEEEQEQDADRTGEETEEDIEEALPGTVPAKEHHGVGGVIDRVLSRTSAKNAHPGPPPDGGARAWIQALCLHVVVMDSWGFINSFGVFQTYYNETLHRPPADISWVGSFQVFLLFFIGTFTGRLTDAGYFRALFVVGTVLQVGGIIAASFSTQYWQIFIAQGVCVGLGNGFLFCPAVTVVSTYFHKRRTFALSIGASGSMTGGLIFPSMVRQLLPRIGFAWTMRSIGLLVLVTMVVANIGMKPRIPPRSGGRLVDWSAFREKEYVFYAMGAFASYLGMFVAFFFLGSFARDVVGFDYPSSLNLFMILNGVGGPGRIVPAYFADRVGPVNMICLFSAGAGITSLCWMAVRTPTALYVWTAIQGIFIGGIQGLFPSGAASLTKDLSKAGVRLGMIFTINSFASLSGPPIAGAIISAAGGRYEGAQAFGGVAMLLGGVLWGFAKYYKAKRAGLGMGSKV